ncbi:hypothetical protein [Sphingomonas sp. IW22]|uniref:hypothetical protein n=1 Tax=Sphingomonas sp. IW22 TaxID=3242489 RepID=UPI003521BBCA
MTDGTPYGEFEAALFVRMLQLEREGAGPVFDLEAVMDGTEVGFHREWGRRFVSDNKDRFGRSQSTMQSLRFELSAQGRARALELENAKLPKTLVERLTGDTSQRLVNIGNFFIAALALVVATIAMLKD